MRAGEAFKWLNVAAGTLNAGNQTNAPAGAAGDIVLQGGTYQIDLVCTGTPALAFDQLNPDGSTYTARYVHPDSAAQTAAPINSIILAGIYYVFDVPPGRYKFVLTTSTANYLALTRVPESE